MRSYMVPLTVAPLRSVRSTTPRSYRRSVSWRSRRSSTLTERRAPPDAPRGCRRRPRGALDHYCCLERTVPVVVSPVLEVYPRTSAVRQASNVRAYVVNGLAKRPLRFLTQGLLVIVGAEAFFCTKFTRLSRRGHVVGRLSVDVDVDPAVDQPAIQYPRSKSRSSRLTDFGRGGRRNPLPSRPRGIRARKWVCRLCWA